MQFKEFPKITRFYEQDVCITEKIDGTNGLIWLSEDVSTILVGSRTRWITPEQDNYGFARWVKENEEDLRLLGPGYHYGEWWGNGIQRGYHMDKKVFSLFNVAKWSDESVRPKCCDVVPVLYQGPITLEIVEKFSQPLVESMATKKYGMDFGNPEGTMMYLTKAGIYLKCPNERGHKN